LTLIEFHWGAQRADLYVQVQVHLHLPCYNLTGVAKSSWLSRGYSNREGSTLNCW